MLAPGCCGLRGLPAKKPWQCNTVGVQAGDRCCPTACSGAGFEAPFAEAARTRVIGAAARAPGWPDLTERCLAGKEGPAYLQMISYSSSRSSEDQIKLLISAADVNDIAAAQQLLERSHDPNLGLGMETPLRQVGLLEASADPDILKNLGQGDLMFAATPRGIVEVVQLLLEASADPDMPNPRSQGHTPSFCSS